MRKSYSIPVILGILFLCLFIGAASATYNGETPFTLNVSDVNYTVIVFLEDGVFDLPEGVDQVDVLVVGGGGAGGGPYRGGGGGAGGLVLKIDYNVSSDINVTVGSGGIGDDDDTPTASATNSSFGNVVGIAGGSLSGYANGVSGGSGSGAFGISGKTGGSGLQSGSSYGGFGNNGAAANGDGGPGGGGAGASGSNAGNNGGNGGNGKYNALVGATTYDFKTLFGDDYGILDDNKIYFAAGGGGGCTKNGTAAGIGGLGGGGNGGKNGSQLAGYDATGYGSAGGGAGSNDSGSFAGGDGSQGIVIVRYLTPEGESYFVPTISYPTDNSTVTDSLNVTVTWDDNTSYTYQAQVSFDDPTFAEINIFYNVSDIETGEYEFALYDVTYYATRVRAFHIADEEYGDWSEVVEFYLNYTPSNIPSFTSPVNLEEVSTMKVTFTYTEVESAVSYDIAIYDNPDYEDPWIVSGLSPTGSYVTYLANGAWYADIRAKFSGEDNYSDWASSDARSIQFDKTNIPVLVTPADSSLEESTINTIFEWTDIEEVTGYRLQAIESTLEPANWTTPDEEWSGSYNYSDEIELSNGVWWWRVQAYDAITNGSWTDPFFFEISIEDIPFIYTVNSANYYDTDEVLYEFVGITSEYDIDIYNVTSTGARGTKLDTLTATPDESNESSIQWTFATGSDFVFETVVHDTGGVLFRHAVKPYDEKMAIWTEGYHRARIIDGIRGEQAISVCIGDMFYSGKDQILHDPYDYPSALYTRGEDIALHYSIPIPTDAEFEIVIKNMETGVTVATILSEDLYAWNYELGYADRNFILISTDGTVPVGADPYLASTFVFEGDDWNTLDLSEGAYDYIIRELGEGNRSSIGESVLLIGDNTNTEWTVTPSKLTLQEGAQQVWTIALPTEEIWGAYNQMMFIDYSDGFADYKLTGDFSGFAEYPPIWQSTFTITYNTAWDGSTAPVGRLYVRPNNLNFQDYEDADTWYSFVVSRSFTITAGPDTAGDVDDWLDSFGFNSELYKLIFAMAGIIAGVVLVAMAGLPVIVIGLVALMLYIVFLALGWIPLWTAILMAMAFVAVLYKMFFGGNGGEA